MDKSTMIGEINKEMSIKLGYDPYILKNGKVLCSSCRKELVLDKESLLKRKVVKDSENLPHEVHSCPYCKYMQGVNVSLKKRISEIKKELNLHEFPNGRMKNKYFKPGEKYNFIDTVNSENITVKEDELIAMLNERRLDDATNVLNKVNEEDKTSKEIKKEIDKKVEEKTTISEESSQTKPEVVVMKEEKNEQSFFDNDDDLSSLFNNNVSTESSDKNDREDTLSFSSLEEDDSSLSDNNTNVEVLNEEKIDDDLSSLFNDDDKNLKNEVVDDDDDLNDIFGNSEELLSENITETNTNKNNYHTQQSPPGTTDIRFKNDPIIDDMIKQNKENVEFDIFNTEDRKDHVFNIIKRSRITDLTESFVDSNAKVVVDRILTLFDKRGNKKLKHKVYINDLTHECPVVDFEGNVRLIFVNLDIPGGQYNIQNEINNRLKPTYPDSTEYDMITFVVFSDMIETNILNRVVRAVSKNIAFNLKVKGIFNPISIIKDSDQYFYTTSDFDRETITRFDIENSAGNVEKPFNGEVALISRWNNPNVDDMWKYRKELSNRSILARGGDIEYDDLSMFMTCSMRYIILPQKPDGSINVTIVDYIESLDLFIRDGFGALIGVLIHNIKTNFPNSKIHLYYELDLSTIPSPTISRYIKNNSIRPVMVNPEFVKMNTIIDKVANQNNANNINKIPVEGEPFDSPEYNANYWKTYVLAPEFRKYVADNKRTDWRRYGKKTFEKTLGERFKEFKNVNLSDRKARQAVMEKIGYQTVIQPQVIKTIVEDNFGRSALMTVMQSCSGMFSISQYVKSNRSTVVDDNYMNNTKVNPSFNPINGVYMTPQQQQMAAMMQMQQQQMQQQQMQQQQMWMMQNQQQMYPNNFNR